MIKDEAYYNSLDKRSKEYREWKAKQIIVIKEDVGVGDVIDKITTFTGIKQAVNSITDDCGCDGRKDALNKLKLKRGIKARCFTEEEYNNYKEFRSTGTLKVLSNEQTNFVCKLYADVTGRPFWRPCGTCSPKPLINIIDALDVVYEAYDN